MIRRSIKVVYHIVHCSLFKKSRYLINRCCNVWLKFVIGRPADSGSLCPTRVWRAAGHLRSLFIRYRSTSPQLTLSSPYLQHIRLESILTAVHIFASSVLILSSDFASLSIKEQRAYAQRTTLSILLSTTQSLLDEYFGS